MNNKFTPKRIVEEKITFSIPLYQRLFSWKEDNVKKLLYDLKEHFEKSQKDSKISPYYLGMLTCFEQKEKNFLLIDGQQRMTVMLLMAIVFDKMYNGQDGGWKKFLMDGNRIEFTARSEDKEYIGWKINPRNVKRDGYTNHNMEQALNVIDSFLEKEFKDNMVDRDKFIENVYHHLTFFISELPQNYKDDTTLLNKYFEAMNSQGRNLEQHEILKVNLLKGMSEQGTLTQIWNLVSQLEKPIVVHKEQLSEEDFRKEYENDISALSQIINNPESNHETTIQSVLRSCGEGVTVQDYDDSMIGIIRPKKIEKFDNMSRDDGSYSIITFEEFLLMVLYITYEREESSYSDYQTDKLLEKFENLQTDVTKRRQFYYNLLYYRLLLDYYVIRREFINGESNYSLLIRENENDTLAKDSSSAKLQQFQSMLYVSTPFYRWLKPFLMGLANGEINNNPEQMLEWLKKQDDARHAEDIDKLSLSYPSVNRYWFWKLDYYLWEKRKELFTKEETRAVADNYVFRRNRSIEHIAPQTPQQDATIRLNAEDRDSFGNLAMISSGLNSALSNSSYEEKRAHVEAYCHKSKSGSIESLKLLWIYDTYDTWNKENIKDHMDKAIKVLKGESLEEERDDSAG